MIEHTLTVNSTVGEPKESPPVRAVTVLYSKAPYVDWDALFVGKHLYNGSDIMGLVGIFFNHQLRHFDITLKIVDSDKVNYYQ